MKRATKFEITSDVVVNITMQIEAYLEEEARLTYINNLFIHSTLIDVEMAKFYARQTEIVEIQNVQIEQGEISK